MAPALAQTNDLRIDGGTTAGVATVNGAAGNQNAQANIGAISSGGNAVSTGSLSQQNGNAPVDSGADSALIAPHAYANSSGWIAVNGAAGNDNQQANVAAFAFGSEAGALADAALSQSRASTPPTGGTAAPATGPDRSAAIGNGAFENSQGLVQVSLIGGDRNTTSNSFALSVGVPGSQ